MDTPDSSISLLDSTHVRLRRERLLVQPFMPDFRASLPRPLRRPLPPDASLAGVPTALRSQIGRNLHSTAFPYPQFLQSDGNFQWTEVELVELENARWRVVLCPGFGGRILRIFDRRANRDLLLQPPVVPQGVIGLPGAWFVGGVELNPFRYGHNIHGMSAVETRRLSLSDGTPAVEFGACDELFGCRWSVTLSLGSAQVFFRMTLENLSDQPQPDYWWTTIAVPAHRHTRIMGAPGPMLHHGMFRTGYQHDTWPRLHGRDWSRWPEHHEILSGYLYENSSDFFGYVDESDGFAFVHQADRSICRGRKLWSIGAGRDNAIWSDRLLEPGSPSYLELQSGLYPMQVECGSLQPGERRVWTESIGAMDMREANCEAEYAQLFAQYETRAAEAMRAEYNLRQADAAWTIATNDPLTQAAPRLELSRRIMLSPQNVTIAEVDATTAQGWVAGAGWRRKLEELAANDQLTAAGNLALAVLMLDAGEQEGASARLKQLAEKDDSIAGWSAYFLGLLSREVKWLERAPRLLAERGETWLALDNELAKQRRHHDRVAMWERTPASLLTRDDVRVARAAGAHVIGDWIRARNLLEKPLPTIAEGSPAPWLIFRETFVAEACARLREDGSDEASKLLFLGGQVAPQFGVGRDEAGWAYDLVYYRWRIAKSAGRSLEASLLMDQAMLAQPYAGSVSAAYLARLALESEHPSAQARIDALRGWSQQSGEPAEAFTPLRAAVVETLVEGLNTRWRKLCEDPLYCWRAEFEVG